MSETKISVKFMQDANRLVGLLSSPDNFRNYLPEILRTLGLNLNAKKSFFLETGRVPTMPDQVVYQNILEAQTEGMIISHPIPKPLSEMMFSERALKFWLVDLVKVADPDFAKKRTSSKEDIPTYIRSVPDYPAATEKVKLNWVCQILMNTIGISFTSFLSVPIAYDQKIKGFFLFFSDENCRWPTVPIELTVTIARLLGKLSAVEQIKDSKLIHENHLLRKSEKKYRKLIKYSSEGIYYLKCGQPIPTHLPLKEQLERYYAHAYIEECNMALVQMSGFQEKSELLGQRIADIHAGENYLENQKHFSHLVENNYRVKGVITQERGADGQTLYFTNEAFGVIEDGHLVGLWGIQRNTTHHQHSIEGNAHLADVLHAIPDTKIRMNKEGEILAIYGFSQEKMGLKLQHETCKGKLLTEVLPVFVAQGVMFNVRKSLADGMLHSFEFLDSEEGSKRVRYYEARINSINAVEVIIILRNITKLKMAEKALTEQINQVDQKNRQLQKYIESNLQLENFAFVASHDLREPVRTMRTFGQFLKRRIGQQLDAESITHLDFIIDSASRMNQLIEDLLTYSRVNTNTETSDSIELVPLLTEITTSLKAAIEETGAKIIYKNLPPTLRGNRLKIQQLFQNLLANGIKFRREGVSPKITIASKKNKTHWQFMVSDNGIGIESEFYEQIFVIFKKLHNHQVYQGTGIGLTVAKRVVEQHGGDIWVESEIGKGTTFYFTLLI
jgi:signal transduction histidine kinase